MRRVKDEMMQGKHRLVYVTPEFAQSGTETFKALNDRVGS